MKAEDFHGRRVSGPCCVIGRAGAVVRRGHRTWVSGSPLAQGEGERQSGGAQPPSESCAEKRKSRTGLRAIYLASRWSGQPPEHCPPPVEGKLWCRQALLSGPDPMEQRGHRLGGPESRRTRPRSGWRGSGGGERQLRSSPSCDRRPPRLPRTTGCWVSSRRRAADKWRDPTQLCPGGLH